MAVAATAVPPRAPALRHEGRREPVRGIRRLIVEHVTTSHREIPAVTYVEECDFTDVDRLAARRARARATALSLREFPELNARLEGDEIVYLDRYDLGLAVQTDQGLVVPVVRGCDTAAVDELAAEAERLAAARAGRLTPARGAAWVDVHRHERREARRAGRDAARSTIPRSAILGIHRIAPRAVVRDGEIVVREMATSRSPSTTGS